MDESCLEGLCFTVVIHSRVVSFIVFFISMKLLHVIFEKFERSSLIMTSN